MALTRKFLTALGIEADKIDEIITAHTETVDALKEQRDELQEEASKAGDLQKKLDDANEKLKAFKDDGGFEEKFNKEHEAFEAYKKDQESKEKKARTEKAYKELLKKSGVAEKYIEKILKLTDLESIELDKDGAIKDSKKLSEGIAKDWGDFIETKSEHGAKTEVPPKNNGGNDGMTKEKIMAIKDGTERRNQIAQHPELFGIKLSTGGNE